MSTNRWARAGRLVAVALIALLAATGCGRSPGVAAYVDGQEITQTELDRSVAGVQETLQPGQQVAAGRVLNVLIAGAAAEAIAEERSVVITDAARDKVLASSNLASLVDVPDAKPVAYAAATQQLVAEKVGTQAYLAALKALPITLNPRFGTLSPDDRTILEDSSGSLSVQASASPTP